jgi:hypothetical protein
VAASQSGPGGRSSLYWKQYHYPALGVEVDLSREQQTIEIAQGIALRRSKSGDLY